MKHRLTKRPKLDKYIHLTNAKDAIDQLAQDTRFLASGAHELRRVGVERTGPFGTIYKLRNLRLLWREIGVALGEATIGAKAVATVNARRNRLLKKARARR